MTLLSLRANGGVELRRQLVASLEQGVRFVLPLGCIGEIWRAATEPPPGLAVPTNEAADFIALWSRRGDVLLPGGQYFELVGRMLADLKPLGAAVFDVLIAAVCIEHRVDEIWTIDARFPRDRRLQVVNPLEGARS